MGDKDTYKTLFNSALKKNETIILGCKCDIWYSGRAESYLPKGDRVVIVKEDNTLLVHQPTGNNPVNYMKNNSSHSMVINDDKLFINSQNLALKEYLDIKINEVHFFHTYKLEDGQSIEITGTERDMANMLYENPELVEQGFKPLSIEEHTKYGFIDLFGYDSNNNLVVVECKRYAGDLSAVTQLRRYVEKIKKMKGIDAVRGILACPKMSSNAEKMLNDWGFKFVEIKPPKYKERFDKKQSKLTHF